VKYNLRTSPIQWLTGVRKQLKAKTMLERKKINCKIIETGVEIAS